MSVALVPIVEGKAEVESVPILLRRVLAELNACHITVARPFRVKRNLVVKKGELERAVLQAIRDRENAGGVLVLLDADDDDPDQLSPSVLKRCQQVTQLPVAVVFANRELEGWFLGAKESLRGTRGIRQDATAPPNPEVIRGAKERLTQNMQGRRYLEVDDQPALAEQMDFEKARQRCPSFEKFLREVERLVQQI
jgi:hypothetical protein